MGVAVVSFHPDRTVTTVGIALGVAAAVCWSLGTITAKRVRPRVEPLWAVALPLVAGGALLVCAGVLLVNVTTTPQAGTGTGAGTSDEDPVATGRQR